MLRMLRPSCREGAHYSLRKHEIVVVYRHRVSSFLRILQIQHHLLAFGECHCELDIVLDSNRSQLRLLFQRGEEDCAAHHLRSQL